MSELDLKKLREVAEKAADGPWRADGFDVRTPGGYRIMMLSGFEAAADVEFIATFNPAIALQLLERVEKAERDIKRWEALGERHDLKLRENGCKCHREEGDSPCPVHMESEQ